MKKEQKLVLEMLKPKVASLGFSKEELEGVAADIANNLDIPEEISDEDLNALVEKSVNAVIPSLKIAQKFANRVIESKLKKQKEAEPVEDGKATGEAVEEKGEKKEEEVPAWAKALIDSNTKLKEQLESIKGERTAETRRSTLKKMLEGTGTFGTRVLKSFDLMSFKDDDAFEAFKEDVKNDLEEYNQERANSGLDKLGLQKTPDESKKNKVEPLSDSELEKLATNL